MIVAGNDTTTLLGADNLNVTINVNIPQKQNVAVKLQAKDVLGVNRTASYSGVNVQLQAKDSVGANVPLSIDGTLFGDSVSVALDAAGAFNGNLQFDIFDSVNPIMLTAEVVMPVNGYCPVGNGVRDIDPNEFLQINGVSAGATENEMQLTISGVPGKKVNLMGGRYSVDIRYSGGAAYSPFYDNELIQSFFYFDEGSCPADTVSEIILNESGIWTGIINLVIPNHPTPEELQTAAYYEAHEGSTNYNMGMEIIKTATLACQGVYVDATLTTGSIPIYLIPH